MINEQTNKIINIIKTMDEKNKLRLAICMNDSIYTNISYDKKERAENAVAKIREKYGYATLQRGVVFGDEKLGGLDIRGKKEEKISKDKNTNKGE